MKKTKIGILLISSGWSGGEKVVYEICKKLSKKNKIFLFLNTEIVNYYRTIKNIKIISLGNFLLGGKINRIKNLFKIKKIISEYTKKQNLKIFNLHLPFSFITFYFSKNKKEKSIISTLHGGEIRDYFKITMNPNKLLEKISLKKSLKLSKKIISVSYHQIQNLPEKYKQKTVVIPNGVDSKIFKPLKSIKQRKNVILFVGRYIDIKGVKELASVARQLPKYEFWFAGQGPLESLIKGKNIKNLGFKSTEELVKLYNQSTICIFPSWHEPFGLVGLEAMSCGRAVIATPKGFSEYIENGKDGIIIPAKNEKALKGAIVDLMGNSKKRKKLEKNARKKALQYSWDKVAKQYHGVYKKILKTK